MKLDLDQEKPIFIQIAVNYKINPATALKGINLLVDEEIVFKKRGVGMFVAKGAVSKLQKKRQNQFYDNYVSRLVEEAKRLGITSDEIIAMIERGFVQ